MVQLVVVPLLVLPLVVVVAFAVRGFVVVVAACDAEAALLLWPALAASVSVSPRMAITCSSSLNCASCVTKVVLSVGFKGS